MMLRDAWESLRSRALGGAVALIDMPTDEPYEGECRAEQISEAVEIVRESFAEPTPELRKMPYEDFLKTDYWETLRQAALMCACYRCARCRTRNEQLHVHHLTYAHRGLELWHPED